MKVSIALCTYNGEKYIKEQLQSILAQTRKVDEVVICDDCSTDNTVGIVTEFINKNKLKWTLNINSVNKGFVRNFLDCAAMTKGDIIFFCDQDDIWNKEKVDLMIKGFLKYDDMLAQYCLDTWINERGSVINKSLRDKLTSPKNKGKLYHKINFTNQIKFNRSPGRCLAIKRNLLNECIIIIKKNGLTYDLPFGAIAACKKGYYVLNKSLVMHRFHGGNVTTPRLTISSRVKDIETRLKGNSMHLTLMNVLFENYRNELSKKEESYLKNAIFLTSKSISYMKEKKNWNLFIILFNRNPMINKWIFINNFLCTIWAKDN